MQGLRWALSTPIVVASSKSPFRALSPCAADGGAARRSSKAAAKAKRSKQQNPLEDGHLDLDDMAKFLEDAERQAAGSDDEDEGFGADEDEDDEGSGSDEDLEGALGGFDGGSDDDDDEEDDEMQVRSGSLSAVMTRVSAAAALAAAALLAYAVQNAPGWSVCQGSTGGKAACSVAYCSNQLYMLHVSMCMACCIASLDTHA